MATTGTPPGTPPKTGPESPRVNLSESPSHTPPGTPPKNPQDSPRLPPNGSAHRTPAGSPLKNSTQVPPDSDSILMEQVMKHPESYPIDLGPRRDGSLRINFNMRLEDGGPMPIQGIIALALNEAARKLGIGMIYYVPSRYPHNPNVPELFYHNVVWDNMDKENWDNASHNDRLKMCTQVRSEINVIPVRAIVFDEPQGMSPSAIVVLVRPGMNNIDRRSNLELTVSPFP